MGGHWIRKKNRQKQQRTINYWGDDRGGWTPPHPPLKNYWGGCITPIPSGFTPLTVMQDFEAKKIALSIFLEELRIEPGCGGSKLGSITITLPSLQYCRDKLLYLNQMYEKKAMARAWAFAWIASTVFFLRWNGLKSDLKQCLKHIFRGGD